MAEAIYKEVKFTDDDVTNIDDFIPAGEFNPHNVRPWLIHDHGFVIAVAFASCEQDAFDAVVDETTKMDHLQIHPSDEEDRNDYMVRDVVTPGSDPDCPEYIDSEGGKWWWKEGREPATLGNASEPFDIESLTIVELPNPNRSFAAQFKAHEDSK